MVKLDKKKAVNLADHNDYYYLSDFGNATGVFRLDNKTDYVMVTTDYIGWNKSEPWYNGHAVWATSAGNSYWCEPYTYLVVVR
jgi:hypothetical protein